MMNFFFRFFFFLVINSIIFWAIHQFNPFPEHFTIEGGVQAFAIIGFIFGLTNSVLSPILNFVLFPLHYFALGLFRFFVNALILWGTEFLVNTVNIGGAGLDIKGGFLWYILFGAIIGCMNAMVHSVFGSKHA